MIFVTVGTHEQRFDRLVEAMDRLKKNGIIQEEIFIQSGYSAYRPEACEYRDFVPFEEMKARMKEAEIVVTHGGTGSIMLVLYHGKIPVVMPRQKKYDEHIDDHQVIFCRTMAARRKIIAAYEYADLERALVNYKQMVEECQPGGSGMGLNRNAAQFSQKLEKICLDLVFSAAKDTKGHED
jgi:UDP-N-acetylglucosamine transferase subunit ALG13